MKKERVEAFTDAVVAIIMTIMALEIKVPESGHISALLAELPYLAAFSLSFIFICAAWYHQHYLLSATHWISKQAFWANVLWIFVMAFFPVVTAWISEFPMMIAPEYCYFICYILWAIAFYNLAHVLYRDNRTEYPQAAQRIHATPIFKRSSVVGDVLLAIVGLALIPFWPPIGLICSAIQIFSYLWKTPPLSDRLFK